MFVTKQIPADLSESINARKGIKTKDLTTLTYTDIPASESINARKGIKTYNRVFRQSMSQEIVRINKCP